MSSESRMLEFHVLTCHSSMPSLQRRFFYHCCSSAEHLAYAETEMKTGSSKQDDCA